MADVHEALKVLSPTSHTDVPCTSGSLDHHVTTTLPLTHTLITSIPTSPDTPSDWKPVKISPKDNIYNFTVYKLPSTDNNGTWFARRSTHLDIPFSRFKAALQREFCDATADSAVRGIGKHATLSLAESDKGKAEVLVLKAQFPGPSAPRVFVEHYLSHEEDLLQGEEVGRGRQFTVVSRPVTDHPDVEEKPGSVRGKYESVEFIREGENGEVEWIMVTRSDPGGSVPRWMVDRGTPNGIVKDAEKFLKWCETVNEQEAPTAEAGAANEATEPTEPTPNGQAIQDGLPTEPGQAAARSAPIADAGKIEQPPPTGMIAGALNAITSQMGSLTTTSSTGSCSPSSSSSSSSATASTTSLNTFATATSLPEIPDANASNPLSTVPSQTNAPEPEKQHHKNHSDRALQTFLKEKLKLEQKRAHAESKHARALEKQERKYQRAMEKAQKSNIVKGHKDAGRAEAQVRELRCVVEALTKENLSLKERVEELEGGMEAAEKAVESVMKGE